MNGESAGSSTRSVITGKSDVQSASPRLINKSLYSGARDRVAQPGPHLAAETNANLQKRRSHLSSRRSGTPLLVPLPARIATLCSRLCVSGGVLALPHAVDESCLAWALLGLLTS